ncbi:MAG: preprotein translocase subunit SecA [Coriobacteriales bacterium]|jgi:preprotein translocase subunit SecA|nr:preprotein translocase subunit SecA [Coriobacteriales bacterium]
MAGFFTKLLSAGEGKQLKKFEEQAAFIGTLEAKMQELDDDGLKALTQHFRERHANGETTDSLLPEAFAAVREASKRSTGMRHFDVQLVGAMALHNGQIAEMKTGEGKTLVSTLAGYLNAIPAKGVHVVTVNDYLAKRDSEWMGRIYQFMGMSVGLLQANTRPEQKLPAYAADVTYGTNSEFGFDYLRDNMVSRPGDRVQRGHVFAIVDEVDSILIDEARTPLIISGEGTKAADTYNKFARVVPLMRANSDFEMDEAKKTIFATEAGLRKVEAQLGIDDIYSDPSGQLVNHLQQALRAQFLFKRDIDYVVQDGEVKIVDEFTGRIMEGRRWSEGLHQAVEAKERVLVKEENQTLATITLQNYFRLYQKLSGMTGTAMTEDSEFRQIYKLGVTAIPSNRPVIREDKNDLVYRTLEAKFRAVADDIAARHHAGQPTLVGTVSIETSELLSRLLQKRGIPHEVLNAKHHEREAHIVAQAGRVGAVTIATNMAGRGTDILLGGNPDFLVDELLVNKGIALDEASEHDIKLAQEEALAITKDEHERVVAAGGLAVIGTERHEARRIDNQLRGRSGRQGDPGCTQFYLSLEDDLMRLFGGDRMQRVSNLMLRTQMDDSTPIDNGMVTKAIESAQRQVESMHFDSRKRVLEYDDVMNLQRSAIYKERNAILDGKDVHARALTILEETVQRALETYGEKVMDDWDWEGLTQWLHELTGLEGVNAKDLIVKYDDDASFGESLLGFLEGVLAKKEETLGTEMLSKLESQVMLRTMDKRWMNHMQEMDYLRMGIGLRAFGQRDPLTEYKSEAHAAFGELRDTMYDDFIRTVLRIQVVIREEDAPDVLRGAQYSGPSENVPSIREDIRMQQARQFAAAQGSAAAEAQGRANAAAQAKAAGMTKAATVVKDKDDPFANAGRNDPCPCGSGKKFKNCHMRN